MRERDGGRATVRGDRGHERYAVAMRSTREDVRAKVVSGCERRVRRHRRFVMRARLKMVRTISGSLGSVTTTTTFNILASIHGAVSTRRYQFSRTSAHTSRNLRMNSAGLRSYVSSWPAPRIQYGSRSDSFVFALLRMVSQSVSP